MKNDENKILASGAPATIAAGAGEQAVAPHPMNPAAAHQTVIGEVSRWEGVTVHDHRMGGVEFRLGRRELGHLHGVIADLPFPRRIRDDPTSSRAA
jgi:hypothetical protein